MRARNVHVRVSRCRLGRVRLSTVTTLTGPLASYIACPYANVTATLVMQAVMMHVLYMLYVGNYNAPVGGRIDKLNEKGAQAENPLPLDARISSLKKYRYLRTAPYP